MIKENEKGFFWKLLATLFEGLVFGGAPGYFLLGKGMVTKVEVSQMIQKESPYVKDQNMILYELGLIRKELEGFRTLLLKK